MTPKEKAKELVERFLSIEGADDCGNSYSYVAKQCALICVDEIINTYPTPWSILDIDFQKEYWQEVKQELLKL